MNLPMAMIAVTVMLRALPAVAGDVHFCTVQLKVIQEIIDARNAGHSEKALLTSANATLMANPNTRKMVTALVRYVYSVNKKTLPHAASIFYKGCLAEPEPLKRKTKNGEDGDDE